MFGRTHRKWLTGVTSLLAENFDQVWGFVRRGSAARPVASRWSVIGEILSTLHVVHVTWDVDKDRGAGLQTRTQRVRHSALGSMGMVFGCG